MQCIQNNVQYVTRPSDAWTDRCSFLKNDFWPKLRREEQKCGRVFETSDLYCFLFLVLATNFRRTIVQSKLFQNALFQRLFKEVLQVVSSSLSNAARNGKRIAIAELTSAKFFRIRKMDTQQLLHPARRGTFLDSFLVLFFRPSYIRFRSLARDERSVLLVYKETRLAICLFLESNREKWLCNLCEWRRARWRTGVWNKWIQEVAYGIMQENLRLKAPEMYE